MSESTPITNRKFASDDKRFGVACRLAGIPATKRQASKFRRDFGCLARKAMQSFIGGGYIARRDTLQGELAEAKKELESGIERLKGLDEAEAKAVSIVIKDIEQRIKGVESELTSLKIDFEILKG